jgi:exocyst complex component 2
MPKPLVTGISPKEGYPGTKVTIRGEFLGKNEEDFVAIRICGVDCTLRAKWEKESRITTYTGFCIGKGDIVVVTKSGGVGSSSVGFQGLVRKNVGFTDESCVWIDEDMKSFMSGFKRTTVNEMLQDNPLNLSSDVTSSKMAPDYFEHEFPNSSTDITKDNFSAMRFLLENYQNAKYYKKNLFCFIY